VNELLKLPVPRSQTCGGYKCKPLQGKSLAPVILGQEIYEKNFGPMHGVAGVSSSNSMASSVIGNAAKRVIGSLKSMLPSQDTAVSSSMTARSVQQTSTGTVMMPVLEHNFAISQAVRCVDKALVPQKRSSISLHIAAQHTANPTAHGKATLVSHPHHGETKITRNAVWRDCDYTKNNENEFVLLGYAMRTPEYRYIAYFHFNRQTQLPDLEQLPFDEELYDHKNETLRDFTHRETFNLAVRPSYTVTIQQLRHKLVNFIKDKVSFGNH
jgi:hypothetical protein